MNTTLAARSRWLVAAVTTVVATSILILAIPAVAHADTPDTTAPETSISTLPVGWVNHDVPFSLTATDNGGSGVAGTWYDLNSLVTTPTTPYTPDTTITVTNEGTTTISFYSVDASGNAETPKTAQVLIDKSAPSLDGSPTSAPNGAGWYDGPVTVHFAATDTLSGVAAVSGDVVLSSEAASQSAVGTATDNAGNEATFTVSDINIDRTAPTTTPDCANGFGFTTSATIHLSPADPLSGVASTNWTLDGTPGSGSTVTTTAVGDHTLQYSSTDKAGNVEAVHTLDFSVTKSAADVPGTLLAWIIKTTGSLDASANVRDVYAVQLYAGETIEAKLAGSVGTDFDLLLYSPQTTSIPKSLAWAGSANPGTSTEDFTFMAPLSGTYYLDVFADAGAGNYSVGVNAIPTQHFSLSGISMPKSAKHGKRVGVSVSISPRYNSFYTPITFYYYRYESRKWRLKAYQVGTGWQDIGTTESIASANPSYKFPSKGRWRVRASFKDAAHSAFYTAYKTITIK